MTSPNAQTDANPDLGISAFGQWHYFSITGAKKRGKDIEPVTVSKTYQFRPAFPPGCLSRDDVEGASLIANSHNAWGVASINVSTADCTHQFNLLTSNPNLNQYLDSFEIFTYDTTNISLTRPTLGRDCINTLLIKAQTGSEVDAGFEAMGENSHMMVFLLKNGRKLVGELRSPAIVDRTYQSTLDFAAEFDVEGDCVRLSDFSEVLLEAGIDDGWFIASVTTSVRVGTEYVELTVNPEFNMWLNQTYNDTEHTLNFSTHFWDLLSKYNS